MKPIAMEFTFQNFQKEYNDYSENEKLILESILSNNTNGEQTAHLKQVHNEFKNLDVKMRLAFGISEILLNNDFVSDKEGDLKLCHLLYYKLSDLWFAYEAYIKLFDVVAGTGKHKIVWLDEAVHNTYSISQTIVTALILINSSFEAIYDSNEKRNELVQYLEYCEKQATNVQQRFRLAAVITKISQAQFTLTHSETLTIIYAIRNNFVHNGETTVVPNIFGYSNKSKLLKILYTYLCLVLLNATNITLQSNLN
jgi:hypothetical protein